MVFFQQQQEQHDVSGAVVIGRLYNRMPQNMILLERNSSSSTGSYGSSDTLINTTQQQRNKNTTISLQCPPPPPFLLPDSSLKEREQQRNERRQRKRCEGYDFLEIVKDAEESPKLSKRSKAKAKKVRLLFQEQQQRHDEQLRELQEQAVAAIKKAAIREEILYYENRTRQNILQTQQVLDRMEISSSSSSEYYVEYNDIVYNDIDNESDNDNDNDNNCFLTHLLPFFQFLKDKFDDQLLKSMP